MRMSLKLRLTLFLALLLMLAIGLLSLLVQRGIENNQRDQMEQELAQRTKMINLRIQQANASSGGGDSKAVLKQNGQLLASELYNFIGLPIKLYEVFGERVGSSLQEGPTGEVGSASGSITPDEQSLLDIALDNKIAYMELGDSLLYMAPLYGVDGQIGVVQFQYSLLEINDFRQNMNQLFLFIGLAVLAVAFTLGFVYFSRIASIVTQLKLAADRIRKHDFIMESPIKSRDEFGELGEGMAFMSRELQSGIQKMEHEQNNLRLAVEKLQQLERQQKEFIGSISHEFKTPLTSIKAYIELVNTYRDDPNLLEEAHHNIGKETERLYEMVEKVLQLSSLERYEFELQAERFDARGLLEDIVGRMRGKAEKFGISMELDLQETFVWCDRESFLLIFINLIDNAIKYNQSDGFVRLKCRPEDGFAIIEVEDDGIGIPTELLEQVFEPFFTVSRDRSRESGGTGLGLSLVRELVDRQGGSIHAQPRKSGGMIFQLRLPLYLEKV
ncbi:HAMP domain-containing protein [Paenibacillaceae bacterium GAS479]|nr:HAMP domain-containing protein [Paenibacillaceae bacterium GAS479]